MLLHETAGFRRRHKAPQSPAAPRRATPQSWGYSFRRTDSSAPVVPRLRPPAGTLPHTALPTPEAKERSCEVDPRRSISSKQSDCFYVVQPFTNNLSDTKRGIERNDFFVVLKAEVFSRELDCISGLVGVHIDL